MYCGKCGQEINENVDFCPECGTTIVLEQKVESKVSYGMSKKKIKNWNFYSNIIYNSSCVWVEHIFLY